MVRGFLWCVSPHEIREFFKDVNIINGEAGIQINKDVNMEARFSVATEDDLNKALAHHNQRMGPRFVSGISYLTFNSFKSIKLDLFFFQFQN